jgi:hypothetical protein
MNQYFICVKLFILSPEIQNQTTITVPDIIFVYHRYSK